LTGHLPFYAETLVDLMAFILYEPIPRPTSFNPDLPPGIDSWWERAAARDPEQRFQSAKEMADQLGEVLGAAAVVGVPTARSRHRGSYPSINDQSGVIFAPAPTGERPTSPPTHRPSLVQSAPPTNPRLRVPVALSAVALLLSIGAIFGVWFRSKSAEPNPASYASVVPRDRPHVDAPANLPPAQSSVPPEVKEIPPVTPNVPSAESGREPEAPRTNSANARGSQQRAPVPRRAPLPDRRSGRDYGI
jgi:serine/threonine-protein kinase